MLSCKVCGIALAETTGATDVWAVCLQCYDESPGSESRSGHATESPSDPSLHTSFSGGGAVNQRTTPDPAAPKDKPECEDCGSTDGVRTLDGVYYCLACVPWTEEEGREIRADERLHEEREERRG